MYTIEEYVTPSGKSPFSEWLEKIKDARAQARILARLDRVTLGNFGDTKSLKSGIHELRDHYSPGYRIYYSIVNETVILLLAGSVKQDQQRAIEKAKEYLKQWRKYHESE